jgi:ribosomal-protein-alanine N-acetyltransferase
VKVHPEDRTGRGHDGATGTTRAPAVHLARMRRRDLRSVLRIDAQQQQKGWSLGLYLAELKRTADRLYLSAHVEGRVAGFAGVLFQDEGAHVTTIAVDQARRGTRIGTRLMLVLTRAAIAQGCRNLTLEVRSTNEPAISLYRRFGLAPAGIRKNYYADIGEDALIMWGHELDSETYGHRLAGIDAALVPPTIIEGIDGIAGIQGARG